MEQLLIVALVLVAATLVTAIVLPIAARHERRTYTAGDGSSSDGLDGLLSAELASRR